MADVLFIAEAFLVWAVLYAVQIPLRKEEHRVLRSAVFLLKLILIPAVAVLFSAIDWWLPYNHGSIMCAIYVALIGDVVASAVEYAVRWLRARGDADGESRHRFDHRVGAPIGLAICIVVLAYGTVNAETVNEDTHEWQAEGLEREHTFAFAADLHTGSAQSMDVLRDFCRQVNESGAEFLILGGDVTDELTTYEEMVETYSILSTVDVPVYFVYGNHDRQPGEHFVGGRTYTDEQLLEAIEGAGITVLVDEFVQVDSDLVLLGREDLTVDSRKDWSELVNPYPDGALIVVDHNPYDDAQLEKEVSALQLSGHTHAGQLWPLKTLYRLFYPQVCGEYDYPGTHLYVTPGMSVWGLPIRTEAHCAWELITLHPRSGRHLRALCDDTLLSFHEHPWPMATEFECEYKMNAPMTGCKASITVERDSSDALVMKYYFYEMESGKEKEGRVNVPEELVDEVRDLVNRHIVSLKVNMVPGLVTDTADESFKVTIGDSCHIFKSENIANMTNDSTVEEAWSILIKYLPEGTSEGLELIFDRNALTCGGRQHGRRTSPSPPQGGYLSETPIPVPWRRPIR